MADFNLKRLYFDKESINDLFGALTLYPDKEFQSPTRSTIPLLELLKGNNEIMNSLLAELRVSTDSNFHLEFTVSPPKGQGIASHTDLMVKYQANTLAVEAKWTEPRYDTVVKWMGRGNNHENRKQVLMGWLDLLQPNSSRVLRPEDFSNAVYQMVHRAASACFESDRPQLAYLHFIPDPSGKGATSGQYQSDLEHLHALLGNPSKFKFHLIEVEINPTLAFEQLRNLAKASRETSYAVCKALTSKRLFEFKRFRLSAIE